MAKRYVIGNWKMNGSLAGNPALLSRLASDWAPSERVHLVVCPPHPYLAQAHAALVGSAVALGAQDVSDQGVGAYTGEVSAGMLQEFGCRHVLVGHSERRARHGETDLIVARKTRAAMDAGLIPVVCLGESASQRAANSTFAVLEQQLDAILLAISLRTGANLVLAYEPLWAIGTGQSADAGTAQAVHAFLRSQLARADMAAAADISILYGGSVKAVNAAEYAAQRDVDGVLVGGASLIASEFLAIAAAFLPGG